MSLSKYNTGNNGNNGGCEEDSESETESRNSNNYFEGENDEVSDLDYTLRQINAGSVFTSLLNQAIVRMTRVRVHEENKEENGEENGEENEAPEVSFNYC